MGKRSVGRATVVLAILATLALVGCQTTAPSAAPSGALGNGQVASLEIVPAWH